MKYLAYVSRQSYILSSDDLKELITTCRTNNSEAGITGMLIYFDGTFTQFLEGPEQEVDTLYQKILMDRRHNSVVLLTDGFSETREFSDWSMAYKELDRQETAQLIGKKDFRKEDLFKGTRQESRHPGILLLKSFVNNLHL